MTKAMRMMQEAIKQVDCVVYVLDCRAVSSCFNRKFDEMIKDKPTLYVLTKSDLVEQKDVKVWAEYFNRLGKNFVVADNVSGRERNQIIDKLRSINAPMLQRYADKGAKKTVRAMIVGVPNTGKSTLINCLCKDKRAMVGNRPGVTRGKQWVSLADGIELLDTPGALPPSFDDEQKALHLAFIGSIKEEILHLDDLAIEIIKYCKEHCYQAFCDRYKIEKIDGDMLAVFDDIAKSRGYLLGKKGYDYDRTAKAVVSDFKNTKLGKIMLDHPTANA